MLDRWVRYGLRELPTAIYPDLPDDKIEATPVTLTTTKHQEVWTFLRPNFDGQDSEGNPITKRITHPDIPTGHELASFYRPEPIRAFYNLPFLRPSVLYIFGRLSNLSSPAWRKQKMDTTGIGIGGSGGAREGRVKDVLFEDAGHLIPMEFVEKTADAAAEWVGQEMGLWRKNEEKWRKEWDEKSKLDKMIVSEEWKEKIGGEPSRGKL